MTPLFRSPFPSIDFSSMSTLFTWVFISFMIFYKAVLHAMESAPKPCEYIGSRISALRGSRITVSLCQRVVTYRCIISSVRYTRVKSRHARFTATYHHAMHPRRASLWHTQWLRRSALVTGHGSARCQSSVPLFAYRMEYDSRLQFPTRYVDI